MQKGGEKMTTLESGLREMVRELLREELGKAVATVTPRTDEYLSTHSAASMAGVTDGTIRRWVREGRLQRHGKPPRILRVLRSDVETLLRTGGHRPANDSTPEELAAQAFRKKGR